MTQYSFNKSYSYKYSGDSTNTLTGTVVERIMDTKSPITRNRLINGWRKPSAYNRTVEEGDSYTIFATKDLHHTSANVQVRGSGADDCGGFWYEVMPTPPQQMEAAAITKALLRLKQENINLAQNYGERRQTARLVEDSCIRLWRMVHNCRRTAAHLLTDPFNIWLEIQYGWKPLLMDVHGAVTELMGKEKPRVFTAVGTSHDSFAYDKTVSFSKGSPNCLATKRVRGRSDMKVRLDYVENDNPTLATLSQLGLTNPLDLAWELLPFSFVVDWFIPIGDYFNCLDATVGWKFKGGSCSTMQRMNYRAINPRNDTATAYRGTVTVQGRASHRKFVRNTYSSSPFPDVPIANDKYSSTHVANGIALLGSAFTNSKRVHVL